MRTHLRIVSGMPVGSQDSSHGFRERDTTPRAGQPRAVRPFRSTSDRPSLLGAALLVVALLALIVLATVDDPAPAPPELDAREWATDGVRRESR